MSRSVVGVIPARYASSRLPGKPLADIGGKPMIRHVVERASRAASLERLLVATDDERIVRAVQNLGVEAVMTPVELNSGTDRTACAVRDLDCGIVVNIQGDEPFIDPGDIDLVAGILQKNSRALMGTLITPIRDPDDLLNPNTAKVIVNTRGEACYFSRAPVPFCRDEKDIRLWTGIHTYYRHIGLYSYRKDFLIKLTQWEPSTLENVERLEQLRVLERGYPIHVAETSGHFLSVDTEDDLKTANRIYKSGIDRKG